MNDKCIEITLDLDDDTMAVIQQHMLISGLPLNDAIIEILEMEMDTFREKKSGDKTDTCP